MMLLRDLLALCLMENSVIVMMKATKNRGESLYINTSRKPYVRSIHSKYTNRRVYRRENDFNYNFEDWEDKRPDVYDDLFFITSSTTSNTSSSTSLSTLSTSAATSPSTSSPASSPLSTSASTSSNTSPSTSLLTSLSTLSTSATTSSITIETDSTITPLRITTTSELTSPPTGTVTETSPNTSTSSNETSNTVSQDVMHTDLTSNTDGQNITEVATNVSIHTTITVEPSTSITTANPIVDEIVFLKVKQRGGYFSASLIVLMKIIAMKNPEDVSPLIGGLHGEIVRLNAEHQLAFLGGSVLDVIDTLALFLVNTPVEIVRMQAEYARNLLMNRQTEILPEANAIIDVVDTVYNDEDVENIAKVLDGVQKYPNTNKTPLEIAREGLEAMVLKPHNRIMGTPRERLLMMEINNLVKNRLIPGGMTGGRRNVLKDKFPNEYEASKKDRYLLISRSWKMQTFLNTKGYLRTKVTSDEAKYTDYVKNKTIMKRLKKKMRHFKKKMKRIRGRDREKGTKRGPSTTVTTTTTTTVRPPMHKSKYYMRKYVKKNLYKMKTTTIKTTTFQWRYQGKIRKFNDDVKKSSCEASSSNISTERSSDDSNKSCDGEFNSESDTNDILKNTKEHSNNLQKYAVKFTNTTTMRHKSNTIVENRGSTNNLNDDVFYKKKGHDQKYAIKFRHTIIRPKSETTDEISGIRNYVNDEESHKAKPMSKKEKHNKLEINLIDSEPNDDESLLRANIADAIFHRENLTDAKEKRRYLKVNKLRDIESFSDDETMLKARIYQVFGYSENFAKRLRTIKRIK